MSRLTEGDYEGYFGFPRVSGDEPRTADTPACMRTFSPRERG